MKAQSFRSFTENEHRTWATLYENLDHCRRLQATNIFSEGVRSLGFTAAQIPDLATVNERLGLLTGWRGVAVEGLEGNDSFFGGMAQKIFPIGNFMRDARDVNYTPAPDVFHDLYGHMPFFTNREYARFCEEFGQRASRRASNPKAMDLWGRLFWFGVEFPLLETSQGLRIFGGGILSSLGESNYALSGQPELRPFNLEDIVDRSYKIDEFQKTIFVLKDPQQLYECLSCYESLVEARL